MNKLLIGLIVVLIITAGAFFILGNSISTGNAIADNSDNSPSSGVVTFKITSSNLRFFLDGVESPELRVKQGETARIDFVNEEGFHDWVLDEFNARTKQMRAGNSETIEFVADKKGTFEYYCSVGQHRANGMKGKFIVE